MSVSAVRPAKICHHCGEPYRRVRSGEKYCSIACSNKAQSARRRIRSIINATGGTWDSRNTVDDKILGGARLWDDENEDIQRLVMRQRDQGGEE